MLNNRSNPGSTCYGCSRRRLRIGNWLSAARFASPPEARTVLTVSNWQSASLFFGRSPIYIHSLALDSHANDGPQQTVEGRRSKVAFRTEDRLASGCDFRFERLFGLGLFVAGGGRALGFAMSDRRQIVCRASETNSIDTQKMGKKIGNLVHRDSKGNKEN